MSDRETLTLGGPGELARGAQRIFEDYTIPSLKFTNLLPSFDIRQRVLAEHRSGKVDRANTLLEGALGIDNLVELSQVADSYLADHGNPQVTKVMAGPKRHRLVTMVHDGPSGKDHLDTTIEGPFTLIVNLQGFSILECWRVARSWSADQTEKPRTPHEYRQQRTLHSPVDSADAHYSRTMILRPGQGALFENGCFPTRHKGTSVPFRRYATFRRHLDMQ